jgi:hypothetical protein
MLFWSGSAVELLRSGLETRRLDALPCQEVIDRFAVDTQHATDSDGVEASVVNQAPNRFGVDAELIGDVPNTHQALGLTFRRRHATSQTYSRNLPIALFSSRDENEPSNFALILPSAPTRNVHGSPGRCHCRTHGFGPLLGLLSM